MIMPNMLIDCVNKCPGKSYNQLWEVLISFFMVLGEKKFVLIKIKIINADFNWYNLPPICTLTFVSSYDIVFTNRGLN